MTTRDSNSLDKYLTEIGKQQMITAEEEVHLTIKIRAGDQAALEKLTTANLRFVVSVAKQYQNYGLTLSDLICEGNYGLIKAAKRFDETRGFKFISYAVWWIRQSILQAVSEQTRMVRLPLNKLASLSKIKKTLALLEQNLEREASPEEIAEATGLSEQEVNTVLRVSTRHVSTDALIGQNEDMRVIDLLADTEEPQPDNLLMLSSLNTEVHRALTTLTKRECDVIMLYYGISTAHNLTLQEIGERYDLTQERVRQIKEKGLRKLRNFSRNKILKTYLG